MDDTSERPGRAREQLITGLAVLIGCLCALSVIAFAGYVRPGIIILVVSTTGTGMAIHLISEALTKMRLDQIQRRMLTVADAYELAATGAVGKLHTVSQQR